MMMQTDPVLVPKSRRWARRGLGVAVAGMLLVGEGGGWFRLAGAESSHIRARVAGGMPVRPVITSVQVSTQGVHLEWDGFSDPYRVLSRSVLGEGSWGVVASPGRGQSVSLPAAAEGNEFFQVEGQAPVFVGAVVCGSCHPGVHGDWTGTAHAGAFETLKEIGRHTTGRCLVCHTVGYGLSTGFIDEITTPHLAGVQCENCHGPGGQHAANPDDLSRVPPVELSAKVCGGCHTDIHHPNYDEWERSAHAAVTESVAEDLLGPNPGGRINSCGPCHSGSTRVPLVRKAVDPSKPLRLPDGPEAAAIAVECAVCHDPHRRTANGEQLRNPVASTNFYSYSTRVPFADQYDPGVSICAQCHNARGAVWTDTSRPPHHSPQHNMLLGNIGIRLEEPPPQSFHPKISDQCVRCHMFEREVEEPTPENPVYKGHDFRVNYEACVACHGTEDFARKVVRYARELVTNRVAVVKGLLDEWGATRAPEPLRTKYGALAWEYSSPGSLSDPNEELDGPSGSEQEAVPEGIKQARFNVYLVLHDGSYGSHNFLYAMHLLEAAEAKVRALLEE